MPPTKFATLSRLLTDLGFTRRADATFVRFDRTDANAWFLFPPYADGEEVMPADLVGVRHLLDMRGLLTREQFEERLWRTFIAG